MERDTLTDVLRALPVDARSAVFGETFSRQLAGCRLASRELQQLHDSAITHVRLRVRASGNPDLTASPLAKFTRWTRLSLDIVASVQIPVDPDDAIPFLEAEEAAPDEAGAPDPVDVVLACMTPEVMQRLTHVTIGGRGFDRPRLVQALVAQLPSLTVLELSGRDSNGATAAPQQGICSCLPPTCLARLQRLVVQLLTEADVASVGALAAGHQLRDLKLIASTFLPSRSVLGDVLAQLPSLESLQHLALQLSGFTMTDDYGNFPPSMLGSRRPPNLLNLELYLSGGEPTVAVAYEPGLVSSKGTTAAAGGGWGMRRIRLSQAWGQLEQLAAALLAVADGFQQPVIPELVLEGSWSLPSSKLTPEAPLQRLLARCAHVEVERLSLTYGTDRADKVPALLAAARLMGLPRVLELQHGEWRCREAVSAGGATAAEAAVGAAAAVDGGTAPLGQGVASQLQQLRLGADCGGGGSGGGGGGLPLRLDTATPEEVLREAVERLWAEAMRSRPEGDGSDASGLVSSSISNGACSGGSVLVMLRGTLPPAPASNRDDGAWEEWLISVLSPCLAAATESHRQQVFTSGDRAGGLAGAGATERLSLSLSRLVSDYDTHIAAPEAGFLLLRCRTTADAATLAALVAAAGEASLWPTGQQALSALMVPTRILSPSNYVGGFLKTVFQAMMEVWASSPSAAGGGAGSGGSTHSGDGSSYGSSSNSSSSSRCSEGMLWRLEQLVELDQGVGRMWKSFVRYYEVEDYCESSRWWE